MDQVGGVIGEQLVDRSDTLVSADATTLIHNASRGYPRAVNNVAVNAITAHHR